MNSTVGASRTVVMEREFAHAPEKVWRALTQPALLEEWLMKNDFNPVVGHKFNFRAQPMPQWNGVTDCEVLAVEPNRKLAYTWNASGDEAENGTKTVVTWTLTPTKTGTLLRLEQSGFRPEDESFFQGANYGWKKMLGTLDGVLSRLT
ncbi:MAG TPA: SRPBCC domain-containing protein [Usitatibacter sp.]|jgi:uncharacterized protein YndB with AHSA1/START domain|nr:SRPBCC domain-containing protein [Usitatibacter sp.]